MCVSFRFGLLSPETANDSCRYTAGNTVRFDGSIDDSVGTNGHVVPDPDRSYDLDACVKYGLVSDLCIVAMAMIMRCQAYRDLLIYSAIFTNDNALAQHDTCRVRKFEAGANGYAIADVYTVLACQTILKIS